MIDKLFGKVRSWLHIDPSVSVATSSPNASGTLAGPSLQRKDSDGGRSAKQDKQNDKQNDKQTRNKAKKKAKNVRVREPARAEAAAVERNPERSPSPSAAKFDAPPPPPTEAFSRTMDSQPESGMVIGESGIIIIDEPNNTASGEGKVVARSPSSDSWALPNLKELPTTAAPSAPAAKAGALSDDWDQVLARARAQMTAPQKGK